MRQAETRTYSRGESISFRKTDERFGGLSNMAPGFPLQVGGVRIRTVEALYQACRFPHLPKVQRLIIDEGSPMTAKMKSKPFRKESRPDWEAVRVRVMRWSLRVKLAQNWEKFGTLLLATGDRAIVEDSRNDDFWGAKPVDDHTLVGENVLGRLLMELREQLRDPNGECLKAVAPPAIPTFLLYGQPIGLIEHRPTLPLAERDPLSDGRDSKIAVTAAAPPFSLLVLAEASAALGHPTTQPIGTPPADRSIPDASPRSRAEASSKYPKRLIEIDLPIKRISAHARREKSIRHGHISTLHIWWARRPLAACRAVLCAALWPDPGDPNCPKRFRDECKRRMLAWANDHAAKAGGESLTRLLAIQKRPEKLDDDIELRKTVLDFIADFANWDNSNVREYLDTSRVLTQTAHEALGGAPGTRPLVVDPFAGGGAIPLEALRVGADAFASDLNPIPVLLNKVVLEYIPKHGQRLANEVSRWGDWIKREAERELAHFYPKDADGATPIAYLWARTIQCEGPGCGAEVPLIRSLWLAKKPNRTVALQLVPNPQAKRVDFRIIVKQRDRWVDQATNTEIAKPTFDATVKGGSATCPCCGYTTPVTAVREQLRARRGGAQDARLMCVVVTRQGQVGRSYRLSTLQDEDSAEAAAAALARLQASSASTLSAVPDEPLPAKGTLGFRVQNYGMLHWADIYSPRQALALATIAGLVRDVGTRAGKDGEDPEGPVVQALLALSLNRLIGRVNSLCWWRSQADQEKIEVAFSGQTVPMKWDFAEGCPLTDGTAGWDDSYAPPVRVIDDLVSVPLHEGTVAQSSATAHPLPDDSAHAFVTDPPYYDAVPYAALSDFFYVWLKRTMPSGLAASFSERVAPKDVECIVDEASHKDRAYFERCMAKSMAEGRRVLSPSGIGVIVFAHKSTAGWEAQLQAMIEAGWIVTGSWPIDTEMESRLRARDSATLASSVHIVCRAREASDGSVRTDDIGDWRDVLQELPRRIHEWMPRLAAEGVVGADAIFACLGPALEIFSRHSRVEKASGTAVTLKEYLEQVWAAVAKEALAMIFSGVDATGFEEDARLTAMWLWTLSTGASNGNGTEAEDQESGEDGDDVVPSAKGKVIGFVLEYDAARKIAQGLGAHLEALATLIEVKGSSARLLPVAERTRSLFREGETAAPMVRGKMKKKSGQLSIGFMADLEAAEESGGWGLTGAPRKGETVLDRVHQSMILFGAGRGEALKRFLVDDGVGRDDRLWRLAQALSALYPTSTDEKRWVDGVLARKKGLGF